jgi:hypothetical protein
MDTDKYIYAYLILQREQIDDREVETLIATYISKVPPPEIGTTIDLTEFTKDSIEEYKGLGVTFTPHRTSELDDDDISDKSYVKVIVEKTERPVDKNSSEIV